MNANQLHVFMAIENPQLQAALLSAIEPLNCSPTVIDHAMLVKSELSGFLLIFLESSNDVERLIDTAQRIWSKWGNKESTCVQIVSYSTAEVTPDSVVFRLWRIGPELTVIVQIWDPSDFEPSKRDAYGITRHILANVSSD